MTPIELGRRAEHAKEQYIDGLLARIKERIINDFLTCTDPDELKRLWDRKETISYFEAQVKNDIDRGKAAERELKK